MRELTLLFWSVALSVVIINESEEVSSFSLNLFAGTSSDDSVTFSMVTYPGLVIAEKLKEYYDFSFLLAC